MKQSAKFILLMCFCSLGLAIVALMISAIPTPKDPVEEVLQAEELRETATVVATIRLQEIRFKVYPEKRIPRTNNWGTHVDFRVRDRNTGAVVFSRNMVPVDRYGFGIIRLEQGEIVPEGYYTILIKGISHLTRRYDNIYFSKIAEYYDFTNRPDLLAGDTHVSKDNFVNSLDISVLIRNLNTSDYVSDLNQDSIVNSLDLSNQVFNISIAGDD